MAQTTMITGNNVRPVTNLFEFEYGVFNAGSTNFYFNDKTDGVNPCLASIEKRTADGAIWINYKPVGSGSASSPSGNKVVYKAVYSPDIDVEYEVLDGKLKESIVLNKRTDLRSFAFTLKMSDFLGYRMIGKNVQFYHKETNQAVFTVPAPTMVDASGLTSDGLEYSFGEYNGYTTINVEVKDQEFLANAIYPVVIDPTTVSIDSLNFQIPTGGTDWVGNKVTLTWKHDTSFTSYEIYFRQDGDTTKLATDASARTTSTGTTKLTVTPTGGQDTLQTKVADITRGAQFRASLVGVTAGATSYQSNFSTTNDWTVSGGATYSSSAYHITMDGNIVSKTFTIASASVWSATVIHPILNYGAGFYDRIYLKVDGGIVADIWGDLAGTFTYTANVAAGTHTLSIETSFECTTPSVDITGMSIRSVDTNSSASAPVSYDSSNLQVSDYAMITPTTADKDAHQVRMQWTLNSAYDVYAIYYTLDGSAPQFNPTTGAILNSPTTKVVDNITASPATIPNVLMGNQLNSVLVGKAYAVTYQSNFSTSSDGWTGTNMAYDATNKRMYVSSGSTPEQITKSVAMATGTAVTVAGYFGGSADRIRLTYNGNYTDGASSTAAGRFTFSHTFTAVDSSSTAKSMIISFINGSGAASGCYIDSIRFTNTATITYSNASPALPVYTMPTNCHVVPSVGTPNYGNNTIAVSWTHDTAYNQYKVFTSIDGTDPVVINSSAKSLTQPNFGTYSARKWHMAAAINGKLYLAGGWNSNSSSVKELWCYDPSTTLWTQLADCPDFIIRGDAVALNGNMYVYAPHQSNYTGLYCYSPSSNTWSKLPAGGPRTSDPALAVIGNKIYTYGGQDNDIATSTPALWSYDTTANVWTRLADAPGPRINPCAVGLNGKLYAYGGQVYNMDAAAYDYYGDLWCYDPSSNSWTTLAAGGNAPTPIGFAKNGLMWVYEAYSGHMMYYDPSANTWSTEALGGSGVVWAQDSAGALIGDDFYVHGGYVSGLTNGFFKVTLSPGKPIKSPIVGTNTVTYPYTNGTVFKTTLTGYQTSLSAWSDPSTVASYSPPPPNSPITPLGLPQSSSRIKWTWADNSADEQGFKVYDPANMTSPLATLGPNVTEWTEQWLLPGHLYTRKVVAYNTVGESSSLTIATSTTNLPTATNITVTLNSLNNITYTITT